MASLETTARALLQTWAEGLTFTTAPTIVTAEPEAGDFNALPVLTFAFNEVTQRETNVYDVSDEEAQGVLDVGTCSAAVTMTWRGKSQAEAEAFLEDWRREFYLGARATDPHDRHVLHLSGTLYGVDFKPAVRHAGVFRLAGPADTQAKDLWVVTHELQIEYPWLIEESAGSPTGLMNVLFRDQGDFSSPGTFDVNNSPEAA